MKKLNVKRRDTKIEPIYYHMGNAECIDIAECFNFNLGNVIKYVWRAGSKPDNPTIQDLRKAKWYLEREITRLEKLTK